MKDNVKKEYAWNKKGALIDEIFEVPIEYEMELDGKAETILVHAWGHGFAYYTYSNTQGFCGLDYLIDNGKLVSMSMNDDSFPDILRPVKKIKLKTTKVDADDLEGMIAYSVLYALDKRQLVLAEHATAFLLNYWDDIDELYHKRIVGEIEKRITEQEQKYGYNEWIVKEWQKVLVKGRKYLTKPDIEEMIKGVSDG